MERIRESYHEEEVSEDVSLCDFPILNSQVKGGEKEEEKTINMLNKNKKHQAPNDIVFEPQEEFAFGSVAGGSLVAGPDMCAADEVFFQGQILPLRPSIGSDSINPTQSNPTRSESMERNSLTGFRTISSSSSRSSSSSGRSTTHPEPGTLGARPTTITRVTSEPRLRPRNQFHTHPSPKLHIRASSARSSATGTTTGTRLDRVSSVKTKHKYSMWDFFRLGLVRTPDIELQEIRASLRSNSRATTRGTASNTTTTPVSRNSSSGGNNSDNNCNTSLNTTTRTNTTSSTSSSANGTTTIENSTNVGKQKRMKFLSGCKCSAEAVASNAIVAKSKGNSIDSNNNNNNNNISGNATKLEKVLILEENHRRLVKMKNNNINNYSNKKKQSGRDNHDDDDDGDDDQKQKKQYLKDQGRRKQAHESHHRTYEWLKELSHANLAMHV